MEVAEFRVKNFKSIKHSGFLDIQSFNTFIGKNDAGKSSFLEALTLFLQKKKPDRAHFHKQRTEKIIFEAKIHNCEKITDYLDEDILDKESQVLKIKRVFKQRKGRTPKADTYVNNEKLSKGAIKKDGESLTKAKSRDFIWDELPKAIFVPAERDVSEETKLKGGTFLNEILVPILEQGGIDESKEIKKAKNTLEEKLGETSQKLGKKLGKNMQEHISDIEEVEMNTGELSLKKAISPKIKIEDKYLPDSVEIGERGSGVGSLFILSLMQTYVDMQLGEGYYLLFEEPGNWLHPGAERKMADTLRKISEEGGKILISTHSQVFIDQKAEDVMYLVRRKEGESSYELVEDEAFEAIKEIGARNSDLLQSDYVIYVEGPSDKKILEEISKNIEGWNSKNITIQHLGGTGNINHCDPEELRKINRNLAFLLDSDRTEPAGSPNDEAKEIRNKSRELGIKCKILERRTIENFFDESALEEVFGFESLDENFVNKYDDIPDKIEEKLGSEIIEDPSVDRGDYNKINHGVRIVREMYNSESRIIGLEEFMKSCLEEC